VNGKPVKIITPLINLSKAEIIKLACENNAPLHLTTTCYRAEKKHAVFVTAVFKTEGFKEAGIVDTIEYMERT